MECPFARMPKGGMPEIVSQAGTLDQIGINEAISREGVAGCLQPGADRAADLRNLDRMGEPGAIKVVLAGEKHLSFTLKPAE
jgi:hypothetical protein